MLCRPPLPEQGAVTREEEEERCINRSDPRHEDGASLQGRSPLCS